MEDTRLVGRPFSSNQHAIRIQNRHYSGCQRFRRHLSLNMCMQHPYSQKMGAGSGRWARAMSACARRTQDRPRADFDVSTKVHRLGLPTVDRHPTMRQLPHGVGHATQRGGHREDSHVAALLPHAVVLQANAEQGVHAWPLANCS